MKKYFLLILALSICLILCACGGNEQQTPTPQPTVEPTAVPTQSPERLYEQIVATYPTDGTVGSYLQDLDGNGISELFIGPMTGDVYERQVINAMYTVANGETVKVFESADNDKYYLTENGTVAEEAIKSSFESRYSYYTYSNGELKEMVAVGLSIAMNKTNPWYEEEAGQKIVLDEKTAMDFIQVYQSTYRNLDYK